MQIAGMIWDLDGTLADTLPMCVAAFRHVFDRYGGRLAIVTGKGRASADISLRRLGLAPYVDRVEVGSPDGPIKPRGMRAVLVAWGVDPGRCAYVGDTPYDMEAAAEVSLVGLGAAWAATATVGRTSATTVPTRATAIFTTVDDLMAWVDWRMDADAEGARSSKGEGSDAR